jgi:hypothetical protein
MSGRAPTLGFVLVAYTFDLAPTDGVPEMDERAARPRTRHV